MGHSEELDARAWATLIQFVERHLGDPILAERMLLVADGIERRNRCMPSATLGAPAVLGAPEWAAAALVARYRTADYRRAAGLIGHGCSPALSPYTPQALTIVETSAEAHAIVFAAEVRDEFPRPFSWTSRHGAHASRRRGPRHLRHPRELVFDSPERMDG